MIFLFGTNCSRLFKYADMSRRMIRKEEDLEQDMKRLSVPFCTRKDTKRLTLMGTE